MLAMPVATTSLLVWHSSHDDSTSALRPRPSGIHSAPYPRSSTRRAKAAAAAAFMPSIPTQTPSLPSSIAGLLLKKPSSCRRCQIGAPRNGPQGSWRRRRLHDRRPRHRRRLDGTLAKRDGELGSLLYGKILGERRFLRLSEPIRSQQVFEISAIRRANSLAERTGI